MNVPGYHMHFLSDNARSGGHVLEIQAAKGTLETDSKIDWLHVFLPPQSDPSRRPISPPTARANSTPWSRRLNAEDRDTSPLPPIQREGEAPSKPKDGFSGFHFLRAGIPATFPRMASDYDGAWKDLLHRRLSEILACYFPAVCAAIDWSQEPVFLDQELRELLLAEPDGPENRVDFLVRVAMCDGGSQTLFLHLEVQSSKEDDFPRRVFHCFHGIRRACGEDVISLAILADLDPHWMPTEYLYERLGCEIVFRFPCCKLLDILPRLAEDFSLPALAAKAQIAALQTSRNPDKRSAARWQLTRSLYEHGYSKDAINEAYRLIAWMMRLPKTHALQFRERLVDFQKEINMPYLIDTEEIAIEQALSQGLSQGRLLALQEDVIEVLAVRFANVPGGLSEAICGITEEPRLRDLHKAALRAASLEDFARSL